MRNADKETDEDTEQYLTPTNRKKRYTEVQNSIRDDIEAFGCHLSEYDFRASN